MRRYLTGLMLSMVLAFAQPDGNTERPHVPPTVAELERLFDLASDRDPEKVRIFAVTQIETRKKSAEELRAEAEAIEKFFEPLSSSRTSEGRSRLKDTLKDLENRNTGIRCFKELEWKSGFQYRLDQSYSSVGLEDLGEAKVFTTTVVDNGDQDNGDYSNWSLKYGIKAARLDTRKGTTHQKVALWGAFHLDAPMRHLILAMLADSGSLKEAASNSKLKPKIDPAKAEQVCNDTHRALSISVHQVLFNGSSVERFDLFALPEKSLRAQVWLDRADHHMIHGVKLFTPDGSTVFESTRFAFTNGLPWRWERVEYTNGAPAKKTLVVFKEIERSPQFDDRKTFAFAPPNDFSITDFSSGSPKITRQAAHDGIRVSAGEAITLGARVSRSPFTATRLFYFMACMTLITAGFMYLFVKRRTSKDST